MAKFKWLLIALLIISIVALPLLVACNGGQQEEEEEEEEEVTSIKIGHVTDLTGITSYVTPVLEKGIYYVLDKYDWEVAGREIEYIREDCASDPALSVAKAKKLVEEDEVDVLFGPIIEHCVTAVAAYAETVNIPHIYGSALDLGVMENDTFFMPMGGALGQMVNGGRYAYNELGFRRVAIITEDYAFGYICAAGFLKGFMEGEEASIASLQLLTSGDVNMAPYVDNLGTGVDCVSGFLHPPSCINLAQELEDRGLGDLPIFYPNIYGIEDPILQDLGDLGLGNYGFSHYSWTIDMPTNNQFVEEFLAEYGEYPNTGTMQGYIPTALLMAALEATGGDTTPDVLIEALKDVEELDNPQGPLTMGDDRVGRSYQYVFQIGIVDDRYAFEVIETFPNVEPDWEPWSIEEYQAMVTP